MALSRADAVAYLVDQYGTGANAFLTLAAIGLTDAAGGLKGIIDDAFLAMGVAYSGIATASVADADAIDARTALRYAALRKVYANLNAPQLRGRLKVGDLELSGLVANVQALLAIEYGELKAAGIVNDAASWQAPTGFSTDWIEPLPAWGD